MKPPRMSDVGAFIGAFFGAGMALMALADGKVMIAIAFVTVTPLIMSLIVSWIED